MTTCKRTWVGLSIALFCALSVACKSDDTPPASMAGTGATAGSSTTAGTGGGGGGGTVQPGKVCTNTGDDNAACAPVLKGEPSSGECAPKGKCCHRASNSAKEKTLGPNDSLELEFRLNYNNTTNHPKTIGSPLPVSSNLNIYALEAQNLLWRIVVPRKDGKVVNGAGKVTTGYGRYNCNGTYSLFSDKAAPMGALSNDPTRWFTTPLTATIDASKTGSDMYHIAFADEFTRRKLINTPYFATAKADYPLDWELSNMGFHMLDMKAIDAGSDCIGEVGGGANGWTAGGHFEVYTPVFGNNKSVITDLGVTYCTLVSFGVGAAKGLDCEKEARCMPGTLKAGGGSCMPMPSKFATAAEDPCCPWLKLPDSLCPATTDDQGKYNCHVGAMGNPNMETGYPSDADLKCTPEAPTGVLDPDKGATSVGQCCDALGKSTTLPACNSYHLIQEFTAAAAEITTDPTDMKQENCSAK